LGASANKKAALWAAFLLAFVRHVISIFHEVEVHKTRQQERFGRNFCGATAK
jgi:hypothetical protein